MEQLKINKVVPWWVMPAPSVAKRISSLRLFEMDDIAGPTIASAVPPLKPLVGTKSNNKLTCNKMINIIKHQEHPLRLEPKVIVHGFVESCDDTK